MGDDDPVRGEEIEPPGTHVEQGVVWKFLGYYHWRGVFVLELAARSDADENQPAIGGVEYAVGAPIIIGGPAHEDLGFLLDFLVVLKHAALELAVSGCPGFRRIDVSHEKE